MPTPNELSFLPDDYLERKAQRRTNVICALLFLVVMLAIGSAFVITERAARNVEREHDQVTREYTEAAKRIQLVQQLQDKQRRMAEQAELAASLLEKVPRSYLLAEVTNALPANVSLLDLVMESKPRANNTSTAKTAFDQKRADNGKKSNDSANAPKVFDVSVKVSGVAPTDVQVAQLISKLNRSRLLKDVNLVISDQFKDSDDALRKFQIEATLNPNADITIIEQPARTAALEIKERP